MAYKMKGSPMQRNFGLSPIKQKYDIHGTDERAYKVNQKEYDAWRMKSGSKAPDVRYLGEKENKKYLEDFLKFKKSGAKLPTTPKKGTTTKVTDPEGRETGTETKTTTIVK